MARIVEGTVKYKRCKCNACGATIEYLPEDVQERRGLDMDGGGNYTAFIPCPREKCPGEGVIRSW